MQSDFSEIPLFTGHLSFLNNITAFIRQTELCEASHNSVTVNVIEAIGRRIRAVDEQLRTEDSAA